MTTAVAVVIGALGATAAGWIVTIDQMGGMDRGVATRLGSFAFFSVSWISMMAAMMFPAVIPALLQRSRASRSRFAAPVFAVSYLSVWAVVGLAVYVVYRPHGTVAAGVVVIAAGVYELTPLKRHFRLRCRESVRSGFGFGFDCVGSSIGLMAMLVVVGVMSITWMAIVAAVVIVQKLQPSRGVLDVALALSIIGFGIVVLAAPTSVPGLIPTPGFMPSM